MINSFEHILSKIPKGSKKSPFDLMKLPPSNYSYMKLPDNSEIKIVFLNTNLKNKNYTGFFLIKACSRKEAYFIADIIRGYFGLIEGLLPDNIKTIFYLQELSKIPKAFWTSQDFIDSLKRYSEFDETFFFSELYSGHIVAWDSLAQMKTFINILINNNDLTESINHLLESRFHFDGYMNGSYYISHYKYEREETPQWIMEKRYYEQRYRYETAFITAFKGIERFFRVSDFKRNEIPKLFDNIDYKDITYDSIYTRFHEIFSREPKEICYGDLLSHFLVLRNAVAAHGNKKPVDKLIIEDNIYEIQLFLCGLIIKALGLNEGQEIN